MTSYIGTEKFRRALQKHLNYNHMVMNERKKQIKVCKRQQYDGGYWVSFHGMQNNQKQYYSPEQVLEIMNKWSLD